MVTERLNFAQRHEKGRGGHADIRGNNMPDKGQSKYRDPEEGTCLMFWKHM